MALSRSITIDGKTNKPTIFAVQAQASYAKSLIFVAEARVAVRTNNYIWAAIASEIAAPIFGANEPPGRLFTTDHELVIIDGEQMFSTQPSDARVTSWWRRPDGSPSTAGMRLTRNVCSAVGSLSNRNLLDCLAIPSGIKIRSRLSISKIVFQAKAYCERFLRHEATA